MQAAPMHVPVLLGETIHYLSPRPGGIYVDCTVGTGGHARAILERVGPSGLVIGIDRDPVALDKAWDNLAAYREQLVLIHDNFANLARVLARLGVPAADGFIFDLGVSSLQLDTGERGFSYWQDAPLDMRMNTDQATTAYHLVNGLTEGELARIIQEYGEERWARRIAQFIVSEREKARIERTGQLVEIIKAAIPAAARRGGGHPARRTFQALRIAVNDELGSIEKGLVDAVSLLRAGGRVCAITFHSLEDRIVKSTFRNLARGCVCPPDLPECGCHEKAKVQILTPKAVTPRPGELSANPRSRSAKLRVAEKLGADLKVLKGGKGE